MWETPKGETSAQGVLGNAPRTVWGWAQGSSLGPRACAPPAQHLAEVTGDVYARVRVCTENSAGKQERQSGGWTSRSIPGRLKAGGIGGWRNQAVNRQPYMPGVDVALTEGTLVKPQAPAAKGHGANTRVIP